ncbi:hypothetical protein ACFQ61_34510 [Streptomyces sp. NPDC056500]|uniref:hypothetical protein n=1 Tax=Streptomyces sp. NPDC056500 TaxID=3345840 RepID=UPI0036B636E2
MTHFCAVRQYGGPTPTHSGFRRREVDGHDGPEQRRSTPLAAEEGAGTGGDGKNTEAEDPSTPRLLGEPTPTVGNGGIGRLELTPTTVVYSKKGAGNDPENDIFVAVTFKERATTAVAAEEVPPMNGGGWSWIAQDGQAIDSGDGRAFNVVPKGLTAAGPVQPGSFAWDTAVFDLTTAQAKGGGTLVYLDSEQTAYRWTIPAVDTGPQIAELKSKLDADY